MEKENLVLIHSFPTNSILLSGLIEYLNDYFNVYFIDLPGFTKAVPPLPRIDFEGYYNYTENKIREFNLNSYVAGGISFGFWVINHIHHDSRCKGIVAIEPYLGPKSLKMGLLKGALYTLFIKSVCAFNLSSPVWHSQVMKTYLPRIRHYPPGAFDVMLDQIDARTFFETANLLFGDVGPYHFHDLPYVLLANKDDTTVNYEYLYRAFTENVERLCIINTVIEHYPKETTKAYFRGQVPEEDVKKILNHILGR
jgi:pimeloyl-ACP methyl ester carboxylesterase